MIHDARAGGENDVAELTRWKQLDNPFLHVWKSDVVAGRNDTGLVESAVQLDYHLAVSVIVNLFEFTDIAYSRISDVPASYFCCDRINIGNPL